MNDAVNEFIKLKQSPLDSGHPTPLRRCYLSCGTGVLDIPLTISAVLAHTQLLVISVLI